MSDPKNEKQFSRPLSEHELFFYNVDCYAPNNIVCLISFKTAPTIDQLQQVCAEAVADQLLKLSFMRILTLSLFRNWVAVALTVIVLLDSISLLQKSDQPMPQQYSSHQLTMFVMV